jgi:hypothetical protein
MHLLRKRITIPYTKTIEEGQEIYRSNEFYSLVFRTIYGEIIDGH